MFADTAEENIALARSAMAERKVIESIHYFSHAINAEPDNIAYKNEFLTHIQNINLYIISRTLKTLLTTCLADPRVSMLRLGSAWHSLLVNDPTLKPFPKFMRIKRYPSFVRNVQKKKNTGFFEDPYFVYGLGRLTVPKHEFERFLTFLRRYLLENRDTNPLGEVLPYALARYCKKTGYIFTVSAEEAAMLPQLSDSEKDQVLLACYQPITKAAPVHNPSPLWTSLWEEDRRMQAALEAEKKQIKVLTSIDDSISAAVQSQYEEYPYPVWDSLLIMTGDAFENARLSGKRIKILAAGCGTGQEAVSLAMAYPDSSVLAIDLSRSSLAYAQMKAREHGIKNIEFGQADILKLAELGENFDFIASSGVLHHMKDPFAGWSILTKILNPGGFMRIALYSKPARWAIHEGQAAIAKYNFAPDDDGMRAFRGNITRHVRRKALKKLRSYHDFYYMDELRDMLFHVQDNEFTIPKIQDHINRLGLSFLQFNPPNYKKNIFTLPTMTRYRRMFADDPHALKLENWKVFEEKYPDTFTEMYSFWCEKPNAAV